MGLGYTFRLRKGARTLDISSGRYALTDTFTPPGSAEEPIMGPGGGINRRGGSQRVGVTAVNQMFSFELDVSGDSEAEVRQGLRDLRDFLEMAGDEGEPVYADWIPHSNLSFQPVYGQWNAQISWEIVFGRIPDFSRLYATNRSSFLPDVMVEAAIKPYTLGIEQLAGKAAGGIYEDWYGSPMRRSKGVGIPPAGANKFANSVYGNSDWDNGWTGDTGIQSSQCTEKDLVLFGKNSAELIASLDALDWYASVTLTAVNHVTQCFAKKRDKSAVTSNDFVFNYGPVGDLATSFYYIGNGWYWCVSAAFTGQVTAQSLGIRLALNSSVIVDGFMVEARSYASPFGYGDMPGWAWDGTAHASASTRTAAQLGLNYDTLINPAQGTITIVWTPTFSSSAVASGNFYLFKTGAVIFDLYWDAAAGRFKFSDGGGGITQSNTTSFTANTPLVITLTWGQNGGARIYINGAQSGSAGGYNAYAGGGTLWVGSDATPANHCMGVFSAFTIYKQFMTSTQVSADYANMLTLVNDCERVDWILWRQTLSGTDTVYTCIDTGKQNYAIFGGVPGTVEAITRMTLQSSNNFAFTGFGGAFLSRLKVPLDYQLSRLNDFYGELSGTADATSSGGAYQTLASLGTTPAICTLSILMKTVLIDLLSGQEVGLLFRMKDVLGTGLQCRLKYTIGAETSFAGKWKVIDSKNAFLMRVTRTLGFKDIRRHIEGLSLAYSASAGFILEFKRSAGTGDLGVDFYQIVTKPFLRIFSTATVEDSAKRVIYDSKRNDAVILAATDQINSDLVYVDSDEPFELLPDCYNFVTAVSGDVEREPDTAVAFNDTIIFKSTSVIPRWGLG